MLLPFPNTLLFRAFVMLCLGVCPSICARPASVDEAALREQVHLHPEDFQANHLLGEYYIQQRNLAEGIPFLVKAWAIDPLNYVNGYDLALAYLQAGQAAKAGAVVTVLLKQADKAELHNLLADIEESEGHIDEAAKQYEIAARMDPSEKNLFDLGSDLMLHQGWAPARKVFEYATDKYPSSAKLRVGLGIVYYSLGQYNEAVNALCQGVDLAPADTKALYFLGKMYDVSPQLADEVTKRLARFVALYPQNAAANYYYALSLRKGSSPRTSAEANKHAEALLITAIKLNPQSAEAHYELGALYEEQSRAPQAIKEYEAAVKAGPDLEKAHFRLARLYQRDGNTAMARKEFSAFEALKAKR